jgi:hypothetical protein
MIARLFSATALAAFLASAASAQTAVPVGHFDGVELNGGGHVTVHHGAQQRVVITSGSAQITKFHIENGNQLVIDICDNNCPTHYDLQVDITTPEIHGLSIQGGGEMDVTPGFPAQDKLSVAIEGGGKINARAVTARNADAAVDGGGLILVNASHALSAAVNGGGDVRYAGNPSVTTAINGGGNVSRDGG